MGAWEGEDQLARPFLLSEREGGMVHQEDLQPGYGRPGWAAPWECVPVGGAWANLPVKDPEACKIAALLYLCILKNASLVSLFPVQSSQRPVETVWVGLGAPRKASSGDALENF